MALDNQSHSFLSHSELTEKFQLETRVRAAIETRLRTQTNFNNQEKNDIVALDKRLFPEGVVPNFRLCEDIRALATLSQFELKEAREITSHRKFLGRLIVLFKRMTWPLIRVHLKQSFDGQQEFNSRLVERLAKLSANSIECTVDKCSAIPARTKLTDQ